MIQFGIFIVERQVVVHRGIRCDSFEILFGLILTFSFSVFYLFSDINISSKMEIPMSETINLIHSAFHELYYRFDESMEWQNSGKFSQNILFKSLISIIFFS